MPYKNRAEITPWPHGRPTIVCPMCSGTGLNRSLADVYISARTVLGEAARDAMIKCSTCEGRGRLTTERALSLGLPVP